MDKSYVLDAIEILKNSGQQQKLQGLRHNRAQHSEPVQVAKIEQVVTGIHELGFHQVVEAALGAGPNALSRGKRVERKGAYDHLLLSFLRQVHRKVFSRNDPDLISHSVSPMVETAKLIKRVDGTAKTVFIGPCVSKKGEYKLDKAKDWIDCVISFEELQAFLRRAGHKRHRAERNRSGQRKLLRQNFRQERRHSPGYGGRRQVYGHRGRKPVRMDGLEQCKIALTKQKFGRGDGNFYEGGIASEAV